MVFTYAVTEKKLNDIKKIKKLKKLELINHNTEQIFVPNQNWGDIGFFTPPLKALYIEDDPNLPHNFSITRRDGHIYRGIVYAVVDKKIAYNNGINLYDEPLGK